MINGDNEGLMVQENVRIPNDRVNFEQQYSCGCLVIHIQ